MAVLMNCMLVSIICLHLSLASSVTLDNSEIDIKVLSNANFNKKLSLDNNANGECPGIYSCANCTAVRLCTRNPYGSGYVDYKIANCSDSRPYCNSLTGTCQATPEKECEEPKVGEYICLNDGKFPAPDTCNKYYICKNLTSYTYTCSQNYYRYDTLTESCIYYGGCYQFYCYNYNGYKVRYERDPSLYAYCINGAAVVVDKCFGKDQLNLTSQTCEPVCQSEGLIPDTLDETKYYRCNLSSRTSRNDYIMTHESCPNGQVYNPYEFHCKIKNNAKSIGLTKPRKITTHK